MIPTLDEFWKHAYGSTMTELVTEAKRNARRLDTDTNRYWGERMTRLTGMQRGYEIARRLTETD